MNRYALLILALFALVLIASCKKTVDNEPEPDYSTSYLPLAIGNTWTYIHNNDVKDLITAKVDGNTFFQGFQQFVSVSGTGYDGMYYLQYDNLYSMMVYPDVGPAFSTPILDSYQPEGYSVVTKDSIAYSNDQTPPRSIMTIVQSGFSEAINGKTYRNVIHTVVDVEEAFNGNYMNIKTYDFYFARGIGLIEIDQSNQGFVYDRLTIADYKIQ